MSYLNRYLKINSTAIWAIIAGLLLVRDASSITAANSMLPNNKLSAPYSAQIAELKKIAKKNSTDPKLQATLREVLSARFSTRGQKLEPLSTRDQKNRAVVIFISSSMPEASLIQWIEQAHRAKATLVMRGLVNQSLIATKAWINHLIEKTPHQQGGITIDPQLFTTYHITKVPAILISETLQHCDAQEPCTLQPYDLVYGNTSLAQALSTISQEGDSENTKAKDTLNNMKVSHA